MKVWYACGKCQKVEQYTQEDTLTDFPRGEFLAHQDFLVTGIKSKAEAEKWLKRIDPKTGETKFPTEAS